MNKIILAVLLLAATGGAMYYYFQTKKPVQTSTTYKEKILGTWSIDSVSTKDTGNTIGLLAVLLDSNSTKYQFQFKDDGSIIQSVGDSILPTKRSYTWTDSAHLVFAEGDSLTEKTPVQILSLNQEQLSIMSADSLVVYFKKQMR